MSPAWEYARFLAAPIHVLDKTDDRDEVAVFMVNSVVQDFKKDPRSPWTVLNAMGAEGWELVCTIPVIPPSPTAPKPTGIWEYLLKRSRTQAQNEKE